MTQLEFAQAVINLMYRWRDQELSYNEVVERIDELVDKVNISNE